MTRDHARMLLTTLAAALLLPVLGGCNNNKLKAERDSLWTQNQELQEELDRTRAALDAAQLELANKAAAPVPAAGDRTGFEGIEGVDVSRTAAGNISVQVPGDVLFAPGKVDLRPEAKQTLNQVISVINGQYSSNTIRVSGYTDTDPIKRSGWKDNLELSLQRAAAVHRYLQQQGVSPERMYAAGYGEWRPRDSKASSRRVEIVVVLRE